MNYNDVVPGVPNPYGPRVHAYPTRYHGDIETLPVFDLSWEDQPFNVLYPDRLEVPPPSSPDYVNDGPIAGLGKTICSADGDCVTFSEREPQWYSSPLWQILGTAGVVACAYHGYKRNESVGWAVAWGLAGAIAWPIAIPVALAQGYGKRDR